MKLMKRTALLCLLALAACGGPAVSEYGTPLPSETLLLYPEGQDTDKGLEGAMGPCVSNGWTEEEAIAENGNISNITEPTIDLYFPEKPNGQMVVICPGGGYWIVSSRNEGTYVADWMLQKGISVCVVKYRMPYGHHEVPLTDVQNAFRYCRANAEKWGISQIGVMGFSAGGHLAASVSNLFVDDITRPDFSILIYPVITMHEKFTHQGTRNNLLGENPSNKMLRRYSLQKQVTENTPVTFLAHCTDDKSVPVENSLRYYQRLVHHNVPAEMHIYPTGGHGWGFSSEKFVGEGNDRFSYARPEFEKSLERWLESIRTK